VPAEQAVKAAGQQAGCFTSRAGVIRFFSAPHDVLADLGHDVPVVGPVAVFGIVLNINFIVVIAVTSDFKFGRDLLYEQVPRFVDWPLLFRLPGWVLDISVLAAHLTVHVLPAVYFCLVQSAAVAARDALLSVLVIPVWCSLATGALVRKGVPITWCNCSPLYARRSDEFWRFAFRCSYTSHAVIAGCLALRGRF
jgi:hypothetical protein